MKKEVASLVMALSGGVDSSVAALLLKEQDYNLLGVHLRLLKGGEFAAKEQESEDKARAVAEFLGIPFEVIDYSDEFSRKVIDYFVSEYAAGRTPNPCVVCNKMIKFGVLLDFARGRGFKNLATGHYAVIEASEGRCHLRMAADRTKDQSYFLWALNQHQLKDLVFPLGRRQKSEVKELARTHNLPIKDERESFEICFVPDDDHISFLRHKLSSKIKSGEVVNTRGEIIGEHRGLPLYTLGQRHGFSARSAVPLYVVGKNLEKNQLIVGRGEESLRDKFTVEKVNLIESVESETFNAKIRLRHLGSLHSGQVVLKENQHALVTLNQPAGAVTPGQSAVFYSGDLLLGGGVIA